ncbi:hypothetical protein HRbin23_01003 [bacterium HR23]|nr:hypothetical protein HRbin23_01003 [bacterium HR23]
MNAYLDSDVGYLLGLLVARGEMLTEPSPRLIIHFPLATLAAQGEHHIYSTQESIRLGVFQVRERLLHLMGEDALIVDDKNDSIDLVFHFTRNTLVLRNISALLGGKSHYLAYSVPQALFHAPLEVKREFVRGFADVAGNVRPANRDQAGLHRVRLDVLNGNWRLPVQLCLLLQEHLKVPVPNIIWGHPNMGREWREHQVNVYADDFLQVGFSVPFKQQALKELAEANQLLGRSPPSGCPGERRLRARKPPDFAVGDVAHLPPELQGKRFDAYWQICHALGCPRRPPAGQRHLLTEEPE